MLKILFRALTTAPKARRETPPRGGGRAVFYAVSLVCPPGACRAARDCGSRRWLWGDAPRLPMPGCKAVACECRYRHHQDRRASMRRCVDRGEPPPPFLGTERRRAGKARRARDIQA